MADIEISAPDGWLNAPGGGAVLGMLTTLGIGIVTTPDVYVEKRESSGSDWLVIAVVAIVAAVLLIGAFKARTAGKVRA